MTKVDKSTERRVPVLLRIQLRGAQATAVVRKTTRFFCPSWVKTVLAALFCLALAPIYVQLVSPYVAYSSATTMYVGMVMGGAFVVHLWPTRTGPWRTLLLAVVVSAVVGASLLPLGVGRLALTAATLTGFGIIAVRANENGRKCWGLFHEWRSFR